jgi:transitional endoplasmic reticulum ATPase
MCNKESVMLQVKLAKKQEKKFPKKASKNYLEAAKSLLELSKENPKKEKEFIEQANKLYTIAMKLKDQKHYGPNVVNNTDNKIGFSSVGGLEDLKEEIRFKIIEPMKRPKLFSYYGKSIGGGILMHGPPGCGKSLIAKATASEAGTTFMHVKSSDIKSKFVGETEKNIAELFEKAREQQPVIIFFDEFEVLGGDRSEGLAHERSAVAQLLTEMDGMESKDKDDKILLLAATNEPWSIDPALRREGRFGTTIFVTPPDLEARKMILEMNMKSRPTEELDYEQLAELTEGLSGADMKAICEFATNVPLKESLVTGEKRKVTMEDMELAISQTKSVMKQWFSKAKEQLHKKNLSDLFPELVETADSLVEKVAMVV